MTNGPTPVSVTHTGARERSLPHPAEEQTRLRAFLLIHSFVFLLFFGLWTWKLLEPNPVPEAIAEQLGGDTKFFAAKGLHACAYSFLTLLVVTMPVPRYWRWFLVGLLVLHGIATEIGQTYIPNRTGSQRDVLIDWIGIVLGVLTWRLGIHWIPNLGARREVTTPIRPAN